MKGIKTELEKAAEMYVLRAGQLRNMRIIVNSPLPKHKREKFERLLSGYVLRVRNARERYREAFKQQTTNDGGDKQ